MHGGLLQVLLCKAIEGGLCQVNFKNGWLDIAQIWAFALVVKEEIE
jgi:hypothetical protein